MSNAAFPSWKCCDALGNVWAVLRCVSAFFLVEQLMEIPWTVLRFAICFLVEQVGVQLADGRQIKAKSVISNATRWDTFGGSCHCSLPFFKCDAVIACRDT